MFLPDKRRLSLQVWTGTADDGNPVIRVMSPQPTPTKPDDLVGDAAVVTDTQGKPVFGGLTLGPSPGAGINLGATRLLDGRYRVEVPGEEGRLRAGAPILTSVIAPLFLGRLYDFQKGGAQTFALLLDFGPTPTRLATLHLTADGADMLDLPEGKVRARRLRYEAPQLPKTEQKGTILIGPRGEILRCENGLFGAPIKAKAPARYEDGGLHITLRLAAAGGGPDTILRAERNVSEFDFTLQVEDAEVMATATTDDHFRVSRMENSWRGRPFSATFDGNEVQYRLAAGKGEIRSVQWGRAWFLPFWFDTDAWEGEGGDFAGMTIGERRYGDFFALYTGRTDSEPFTLLRLQDTYALSGSDRIPLHRYRMSCPSGAYDLTTDGARLMVLLGSDGLAIVRGGWETYAAALKPPSPPDPKDLRPR
jgi:hypothetical protein